MVRNFHPAQLRHIQALHTVSVPLLLIIRQKSLQLAKIDLCILCEIMRMPVRMVHLSTLRRTPQISLIMLQFPRLQQPVLRPVRLIEAAVADIVSTILHDFGAIIAAMLQRQIVICIPHNAAEARVF